MNESRVVHGEMYTSLVWSGKNYEGLQVNFSSPSLTCEMILTEQVADRFFVSLEFLLAAEFLSAQFCEERRICV